ncbi:MAG TPA: hypothetical protein VMT34_12565 [Aggregatilineales bacterium]|nr:hypothetical protein [Aggregatilineales bacterium]
MHFWPTVPYPTNPVLEHDLRRIRWSPAALTRFVNVTAIWAATITFMICAGIVGYPQSYYGSLINRMAALLFLGVSIAFGLGADLYYGMLPIGGIQREIAGGHWDLVRISLLNPADILAAKFRVAFLRSTRLLLVEIALRAIAGVPLCCLFVLAIVNSYANQSDVSLMEFAILCLGLAGFLSEPLLRRWTLLWTGIALAMETRDHAAASFLVIITALGLRLAQFTLLIGVLIIVSILSMRDDLYLLMIPVALAGGALDYLLYRSIGAYMESHAQARMR